MLGINCKQHQVHQARQARMHFGLELLSLIELKINYLCRRKKNIELFFACSHIEWMRQYNVANYYSFFVNRIAKLNTTKKKKKKKMMMMMTTTTKTNSATAVVSRNNTSKWPLWSYVIFFYIMHFKNPV